jgi:cell division protein FtsA
MWEIRRSGYERKLIGGIVLTGGGSLLKDIDKLCEFHTGNLTRIGIPIEHLAHGYAEQVCSPIFATGIGLLMKAANEMELSPEKFDVPEVKATDPEEIKMNNIVGEHQDDQEDSEERRGWLNNMFKKTKEWFEAEPDTEF